MQSSNRIYSKNALAGIDTSTSKTQREVFMLYQLKENTTFKIYQWCFFFSDIKKNILSRQLVNNEQK